MAEYIEREAGCRRYCFHYDACSYHITEETKLLTVNECPLFVNKADVVEVRHGKWTDNGPYDKCSVCKTLYKDDLLFILSDCEFGHPRYCPNCGAKMDGKGEGE